MRIRKKINFGTKLKIFKIIPLYPRPDGINKNIAHDSVPLKLISVKNAAAKMTGDKIFPSFKNRLVTWLKS